MRFYNSGKYTYHSGVNKETGEPIKTEKPIVVKGQNPGAAIVNFPGHGFYRVVEQGQWVDLPDDLGVETVQRSCPCLLTEEEAIPVVAAAEAVKPMPKPTK